jgi:hypothetical protein
MFFKTTTVYKAYNTERGALNYIARNFANDTSVTVKFAGSLYYVVGA